MSKFYEIEPTLENYWRSILLFGRNVASYKFALAKALYDLKDIGLVTCYQYQPKSCRIKAHLSLLFIGKIINLGGQLMGLTKLRRLGGCRKVLTELGRWKQFLSTGMCWLIMVDIKNFRVMKKRCPTCPFGKKGQRDRCPSIASRVREQCLSQASQICHHPALHGNSQTHLCRGARDFQLEIFHRLGVLEDKTDQAWDKGLMQYKKM